MEEKSGYSLRTRKQVRVYESSGSDESDEEEVQVIKRKPATKSRRKDPDEEDPDFRDEDEQQNRSDSAKKSPVKRIRPAPVPMIHSDHTFVPTARNGPQYIPIMPKAQRTPPTTCAVRSCTLNTNRMLNDMERSVTIHPFPCQPALRYNWIKAVRPNQPFWQPFPTFGVCALHFAPGSKPWCGDPPTLYLPSTAMATATTPQNNKIVIQPGSVVSLKSVVPDYHETLYGQKSKGGFTISETNLTRSNPTKISFGSNGGSSASQNVSFVKAILPKGINLGAGTGRIGIRLVPKPTNAGVNVKNVNFSNATVFTNGVKIISSVDKSPINDARSVTVKVKNESVSEPLSSAIEPKTNVEVSNIMPGISIDDGSDDDDENNDADEKKSDSCSEVQSLRNASPTPLSDVLPAIAIDDADDDDNDVDGDQNESEDVSMSTDEIGEVNNDIVERSKETEKVIKVGDKRLIFQKTAKGYLAKSVIRRGPLRNSTYDPQLQEVLPRRITPLVNNMPQLTPQPQPNFRATDVDVNQILGSYVYKGLQTFFCSLCRLHMNQCTRFDVSKHMAQHKIYKTLYECRLCGTTFDSFKFLFCHWKRRMCYRKIPFWMCTLNGNLIESWTCFVCGMNSAQSRCSSLVHHVQAMHADVNQLFNDVDNVEFKCVVCGLQLYTANAYFNHVGRTHYHLCNVYQSDVSVSLKYLEENTPLPRTTARFRGDSCSCQNNTDANKTGPKSSMSEILSNYLILERYKRCFNCMKEFEFLRQLISHTYTCATTCKDCSMKFFDFWSESSHRIFTHWLKKCPVCNMIFDKAENESTILRHFREIHKFSERELAADRMCGYPTPLLFEDGAIYYCQTCHDEGNVLYFSLQSCLMRYHRFMRTEKVHRCVIFSGNTESCIRNRIVSNSYVALCDSASIKNQPVQDDIPKLISDTVQVKIEPPDNKNETKPSTASPAASAFNWELQNAISVFDEDDDDDQDENDEVIEKVSDDVEILAVQKPEPPLVDLSIEESKSYVLSTMMKKSLHCWCLKNLHTRTVQKNRAWALRLNICEWEEIKKCALCQRKSKNFLNNVTHVCAHFKCTRIICDRCGMAFVEKKHRREHLKRCKKRFYGIKEMRVLAEKLNEKSFAADSFPTLTEIEYLDSLGVKKNDPANVVDDDDDELRVLECDDDYEGAICKVGQCFKCFPNRDQLFNHIVDVHLTEHWKNAGSCCLCQNQTKFPEPSQLRNHLRAFHWKDLYPAEFQMKPPRKRASVRSQLRATRSQSTSQKVAAASYKSLFRCDECNLFFRALDEFETHMWQVHTGADVDEETFPCTICKATLNSEVQLEEHLKVSHPAKYFCWKCAEFFVDRRSCVRHAFVCQNRLTAEKIKQKLKLFGLNETNKRCELCSLDFPTTTRFRGHLRLHCCKTLAKCISCKKNFVQFQDYFKHRKLCKKK